MLGFYGLDYWYAVAGHHPRPRPGLAERQRRRRAGRRQLLADGGVLRLRPVRAGPRRRHLLHRHAPDARDDGSVLPGERLEVLHRQRQRRRARVGVRPARPTWRARTDTSSSPLTASHPAYRLVKNVVAVEMYVSEFALRGLPRRRRTTSCTPAAPRSTPPSTRSTSASSTCASARSAWPSTRMYEAITHAKNSDPLRQAGHRLPARPAPVRRRLRAGSLGDEAVQRPRGRLLPHARARRPPLPVVQPDDQDEGDHRGRAGRRPMLGTSSPPRASRRTPTSPRAPSMIRGLPKLEGTVHVNLALILKFMPQLPARPGRPTSRSATRLDAADDAFFFRQGPARGLGKVQFHDWHDGLRGVRASAQRGALPRAGRRPCDPARRPRPGRGRSSRTSTACSAWGSCSRSSSTAS